MPKITKITQQMFNEIKKDTEGIWIVRMLSGLTDEKIAVKYGVKPITVMKINALDDYEGYQRMCKAQHPPVKFSLADHVLALHRKEFEKYNTAYVEPLTAKGAILELLNDKEQ